MCAAHLLVFRRAACIAHPVGRTLGNLHACSCLGGNREVAISGSEAQYWLPPFIRR